MRPQPEFRRPLVLVMSALSAISVSAGPASAPQVYRCGSASNPSYSQSPCPGGAAVEVGDERSAAQRSQAAAIAEKERRMAERLAAERRQNEEAAARRKAGSLSPVQPASRPASSTAHRKHHPKKASEPDPGVSRPFVVPKSR